MDPTDLIFYRERAYSAEADQGSAEEQLVSAEADQGSAEEQLVPAEADLVPAKADHGSAEEQLLPAEMQLVSAEADLVPAETPLASTRTRPADTARKRTPSAVTGDPGQVLPSEREAVAVCAGLRVMPVTSAARETAQPAEASEGEATRRRSGSGRPQKQQRAAGKQWTVAGGGEREQMRCRECCSRGAAAQQLRAAKSLC